jgi:hypothetical protein
MTRYRILVTTIALVFLEAGAAHAQPSPQDLLQRGIRITPDTKCQISRPDGIILGRGGDCLQCAPGQAKDLTHLICIDEGTSGSSSAPPPRSSRSPREKQH